MLPQLTDAEQDYLRELYELQIVDAPVRTTVLADRMRVAPPSATAMVKRLAALGLADHRRYHGVRLTAAGETVALALVRRHRLLETYLANALDITLDELRGEADRLEHAVSDEVERRIDAALGSPRFNPHGDPIPSP
jgi:DtxR family transcriptional regulator, Mn-dependent transcriptional regulator